MKEKNQKKDFVKSYLTITGLSTLWIVLLVALFKVTITENIFLLVFTLFSNVITSIVTYYFTRKTNEKKESE